MALPNCPTVFDKTQLHLALWDRLDLTTHAAGLALCKQILGDEAVSRATLLLVYPHRAQTPSYYASRFAEPDDDFSGPWCEVWFQTGQAADTVVRKHLTDWRASDPRRRRFRRYIGPGGPLWPPLSSGLVDCQYANARTGGAQRFLCDVPRDQVAWLLKVIWHRATPAVVETCLPSRSLRLLNPLVEAHRGEIQRLAQQALSDFTLAEYAIDGPQGVVDPTAYFVSHLTCWAINAATAATPVYLLEHYYSIGRAITRPSGFPDRDGYLEALLHL